MTNTTDTTSPKFRKIMCGLYGTGIHRRPYGSIGFYEIETIEVVIDRIDRTWYVREMTPEGDCTDSLGEAYYTLADAKAAIMRRPSLYA